MKVTRICMLESTERVDFEQLDQLMRVFCCAVRYSFNRLIEGEAAGEPGITTKGGVNLVLKSLAIR